uniref:Uncharacterized protein n=1 Tax=Eutreptiella gymnastica TaxID=73025 RepID=A0A7S4CL40_9EUGL
MGLATRIHISPECSSVERVILHNRGMYKRMAARHYSNSDGEASGAGGSMACSREEQEAREKDDPELCCILNHKQVLEPSALTTQFSQAQQCQEEGNRAFSAS